MKNYIYLSAKQASILYNEKDCDKVQLKKDVLRSIAKTLKRGHLRFDKPYEAEGRRVFHYIDAMRGYSSTNRDCSYALVDLELLDLIVLLSEINKKQSETV